MHAENGRLRGVDDGGSKEGSEDAPIGNGEGAAVHVFHGQLVVLGLISQGHDALFDVCVIHILYIA